MVIDIITLIILVVAIWKGISRGFIIAICSFIAIFIGLAAAIKCSALVAVWLQQNTNIATKWLPFLSFVLIMLAVILLVRLLAKFLETVVDLAMLGWLNKLGGIILYMLLYLTIWSIILFYATRMQLINADTTFSSLTYSFIEPWGPDAINAIAAVIPFFKDMFEQLQHFFENATHSQQNIAV